MTNVPFEDAQSFLDIESVNYYRAALGLGRSPEEVIEALREGSRDNARSPVQWDASPHAGFTTGEPWFPVNPNHVEINADAELADPDSVFHHYRRLIELRHSDPVVADGDFHMLLPEHPAIYAFTRSLDTQTVLVVANFSGDDQQVEALPGEQDWGSAELVLGNYPDPGAGLPPLRPWEARVYRPRA